MTDFRVTTQVPAVGGRSAPGGVSATGSPV